MFLKEISWWHPISWTITGLNLKIHPPRLLAIRKLNNSVYLTSWLFGIYGISTFVGYLTPNPFFMKIVLSNNSV